MSAAASVRRRTAGVVFLLVPALLAWFAVEVYDKAFSGSDTVTVLTGSVGNEMHLGADVKLRGVVVGRVQRISADGAGARLTLAIDPSEIDRIPDRVTAQMLPTTLFGERFVALVPPAGGAGGGAPLRPGAVISQDRSSNAIELQQVLDHLLPLLTAVQPEKLSETLNAVSTALSGRGTQLGSTLVQLDGYLTRLNPQLPALTSDIRQLVTVSRSYDQAAPDIVQALTEFTATSRTIADEQSRLATLYGSTTTTARDLTTFLQQNKDSIIRLSVDSRGTLGLLAEYAPSFPCTLQTLANFVPVMDKALGKGTGHPGLHVDVTAVPSRGGYQPGRDTPVYNATGGPRCYAVPYTGAGRVPAAGPGQGVLGLANSPQENELVNELLAPGIQSAAIRSAAIQPAGSPAPQSLPSWSSLLAGPVLRGTEVTLK